MYLLVRYLCFVGHTDTARALIRLGADPSICTPGLNQTVLHVATNSGSVEMVRAIYMQSSLSAVTNIISSRDSMGNTPLHLASTPEVIEFLLTKNADISALNNNFETPLMCSAKWGYRYDSVLNFPVKVNT